MPVTADDVEKEQQEESERKAKDKQATHVDTDVSWVPSICKILLVGGLLSGVLIVLLPVIVLSPAIISTGKTFPYEPAAHTAPKVDPGDGLLLPTIISTGKTFPDLEVGDGFSLQVTHPGDGKTFPKSGDSVSVHYTGTFGEDDLLFVSTRDGRPPFEFVVGSVDAAGPVDLMVGLEQGILKMSLGERAKLFLPKVYVANVILRKDLKIDVELLKINGLSKKSEGH